jgi:hypothetical protein
MLWSFGLFYSRLAYFVAIWYFFVICIIFSPFWYVGCKKKNLATLIWAKKMESLDRTIDAKRFAKFQQYFFSTGISDPVPHRLGYWQVAILL